MKAARLVPLLGLALLAPALSGCVAPQDLDEASTPAEDLETDADLTRSEIEARLSKPTVDEVLYEETSYTASDGTRIGVNLFRPAPGEVNGSVPAIVVMTPYKTVEDILDRPYSQSMKEYFVPRGYALVFVDVRGTNDSGGCIGQTGERQAQDGYEAVEWVANRSWSDGEVGMFGASYDAETQQSTATLAPPHLETIVPVASITNQYLWFFKGGVPWARQETGMTAYAAIGATPPTDPDAASSYPDRFSCQAEAHREAADPEGQWNDFWEERYWKPGARDVEASVLYVHGLQDWNVKPDAIPGWYNDLETEKRAILGQWGHAYPDLADWTFLLHRWFDQELKGIDAAVHQGPDVLVEASNGQWREADAFPPTPDRNLTLYLRGDDMGEEGVLSPEEPRPTEDPDAYRDVPVPEEAGQRPPHVAYASEPLTEELHVSGVPDVRLHFSSSAEETHLVYRLLDVAPDGEAHWVDRGYRNARYHHGDLSDPQDLEPGTVYETRLSTYPVDHVFPDGHRIVLLVMSDDAWAERDQTTARNAIHHDAEHPSSVTLPVVDPPPSAFPSPPHPTADDVQDDRRLDPDARHPVELEAWGLGGFAGGG
jgi:X-Pro dipeptidyl-peptidase